MRIGVYDTQNRLGLSLVDISAHKVPIISRLLVLGDDSSAEGCAVEKARYGDVLISIILDS